MEINRDQLWNMTSESANIQNAMAKVFFGPLMDDVKDCSLCRRVCQWHKSNSFKLFTAYEY